jgi:hypothetical protein
MKEEGVQVLVDSSKDLDALTLVVRVRFHVGSSRTIQATDHANICHRVGVPIVTSAFRFKTKVLDGIACLDSFDQKGAPFWGM